MSQFHPPLDGFVDQRLQARLDEAKDAKLVALAQGQGGKPSKVSRWGQSIAEFMVRLEELVTRATTGPQGPRPA